MSQVTTERGEVILQHLFEVPSLVGSKFPPQTPQRLKVPCIHAFFGGDQFYWKGRGVIV